MIYLKEDNCSLERALGVIGTFPRGVIIRVETRYTQTVFSSSFFELDPDSNTPNSPDIIAECNKQSFGGLAVDPKAIKKIENNASGFKFTLADGVVITVIRN